VGGPGPPPPRPPASSRGITIDLSAPLRRVGRLAPAPLRRAARAAQGPVRRVGRVADAVSSPFEPRTEHPGDGAVAGCAVPAAARVTGLADTPAPDSGTWDVQTTLVRLQVARPEGVVELCVRQHVPHALRGTIAPGTDVPALVAADDPGRAVVDWTRLVHSPDGHAWVRHQLRWPPPEDWPAVGRIEVRDHARHRRRMDERRATWRSVWARPTWIGPERGRVDGRPRYDIALALADGPEVTSTERVPILALDRVSSARTEGDGLVAPTTRVARSDLWVPALTDGRDACVDWQGFLDQLV
jgi:hypothetical protein